jgi:hypothetical protein
MTKKSGVHVAHFIFLSACLIHRHNVEVNAADPRDDSEELPGQCNLQSGEGTNTDQAKATWPTSPPEQLARQPQHCSLYYDWTSSYNGGDEDRFGLFTTGPIQKNHRVGQPGIVLQVTDPLSSGSDNSLKSFLEQFAVDAQATGGQYEGMSQVFSVLPGVGMTRHGSHQKFGNVMSYKADIDEADLTRTEHPGAGANSHYYNISYYAVQDLFEGDELVIASASSKNNTKMSKTARHLVDNGMCADNLKLGKSKINEAGRGAVATRHIPKGALVSPVPVMPVTKHSLAMTRTLHMKQGGKKMKKTINTTQLLMNYCFGHRDSDVLFFPYSSGVNFINHANGHDGNYNSNAKLQWSSRTLIEMSKQSNVTFQEIVDQSSNSGMLLLDLIATRDILPGEEVFLDYGVEWTRAWNKHVKQWKPVEDDSGVPYAPAYVMNEVTDKIRTQQEQEEFYAYPDNLQLACFYKYSEMVQQKKAHEDYDKSGVTMIKWRPTKDITNLRYLRPCQIIKRDEDQERGTSRYTVKMLNRPGNMTPPEERIPSNEVATHLVAQVPRPAIRFVDKPYSTDQHLPNAFRHYIGLTDDLLPPSWKTRANAANINETP